MLRVTMLGSGTSTGVPMIGCDCPVCTSPDPRNRRLRTSLLLETAAGAALVDTSPDLRQQALRAGIGRLDAVLYTHHHADHVNGIDELRAFNFRQGGSIPCYGPAPTLAALRRGFAYIFDAEPAEGGGKPQLELVPVRDPFEAAGLPVVPVPVWHGSLEVFGYRIGGLGYVTDCKRIPDQSLRLLEGVELLVLDALRYRPHPTHLSIGEAMAVAERIGPRRTVLTHLTHEVDHAAPEVALPDGVELGYDGLVLDV